LYYECRYLRVSSRPTQLPDKKGLRAVTNAEVE
jgi:hypothetical protein